MSAVETLERCLDRALTAMNEACVIDRKSAMYSMGRVFPPDINGEAAP